VNDTIINAYLLLFTLTTHAHGENARVSFGLCYLLSCNKKLFLLLLFLYITPPLQLLSPTTIHDCWLLLTSRLRTVVVQDEDAQNGPR